MDPRIREQAEVVVDYCAEVEQGDNVIVQGSPVAEDLVVAIYELLGERGANGALSWSCSRASRAYMRNADPEAFELSTHSLARMEETDVVIQIGGSENTNETSDVDPEKSAARARVNKPIQEEYMQKRFVLTQHPAPANAQEAEMSTEAYEEFVYDAINRDWEAQREHQEQLVELLEPADEVRIVSGDTTDVTMSVAGNHAVNDHGEKNMPAGEVFTAPIPDSVEGEVLFDKPLLTHGREVTDVRLVFEDGEVVEHSAEKNEEVLTAALNADEGARRLGELGIGMNRDIDRFTYNMLFDEKMGDTVHMAIGKSIDESVGEGGEANDSTVHMDMIVDMSEDSYMAFDGEVVQRDGTFVFEEGFEAE